MSRDRPPRGRPGEGEGAEAKAETAETSRKKFKNLGTSRKSGMSRERPREEGPEKSKASKASGWV